jgi:hypothetical protein
MEFVKIYEVNLYDSPLKMHTHRNYFYPGEYVYITSNNDNTNPKFSIKSDYIEKDEKYCLSKFFLFKLFFSVFREFMENPIIR